MRARTAGASNTTEFFAKEATRLRNAVAEMETRVSEYKAQNSDSLPEHLNMHLSMLERARNTLGSAESSITQLEEERRFLETQLISGTSGDGSLSNELARLEAELARMRATYHDNYPEVVAKRQEIASIKARMAPSADIKRMREALAIAEDRLTAAERAETPDPEAIATAEAGIEAARNALSDRIAEETRKGTSDITGVQIEGRIAVIENRIRMLNKQLTNTMEQTTDLEQRIARTPEVERGIASLTRDYDNLFAEYQDVLAKQQDAQLAENLEENQQAEKFSILEPALRPDKPSSPDRAKLLILALFAAFGAGGAAALGMELLQAKLRGRSHLTGLLETQPIAVIPYIHSDADKDTPWRRVLTSFAGKLLRKTKLAQQEPEAAL